jgi:outer membrane protein assembly factor BamE (lipoprotein component of BamABCDE complex)
MHVHKLSVVAVSFFAFIAGCASHGTKMDRAQVEQQIHKGVTTRSEVERNLGTPDHVAMLPDGKRMLQYSYSEVKTKGSSFIPYAGFFAGGSNSRQQTLQIMLDANGVVKDYEFSDKATEQSGGVFNAHSTEPTEK